MAENYYSIGKGEIRQDAALKVTGAALYSTDIHPKGMVYGKILGSPIPHGIIKSIDTSEAEKLPGVVAVRASCAASATRSRPSPRRPSRSPRPRAS